MAVKVDINNNILTLYLVGDIDHHTAKEIREIADLNIDTYSPKILIIDFKEVAFMDTSGIGLVMGRYKLIKSLGGEVKIINLSPYLKRIMSLSGLSKLVKIN
ncbi:MAG: anti-sigma factor antagonist [Oscillospiraceae bacterium]|nr:anti-sigma factor antagonist [Oscillospiraceae bacterium]